MADHSRQKSGSVDRGKEKKEKISQRVGQQMHQNKETRIYDVISQAPNEWTYIWTDVKLCFASSTSIIPPH